MTIRTKEEILEQFRISLREDGSELANFPDFGNLYAIYRAVAGVINEQDAKIDILDQSLFIDTASGEALDRKSAEFNIRRSAGSPASGSVIISGGNSIIPVNTILVHPASNIQYRILERVTINTNQRKIVAIESIINSRNANLPAGTKLTSSLFPNTQFTVGTTFNSLLNVYQGDLTGGISTETDNELRTRLLNFLNTGGQATKRSIELEALRTPGITKTYVSENEPALGFTTVYINNNSQSLKQSLQRNLDNIKPIGTSLIVKPFTVRTIDIIGTITLNYNTDTSVLNTSLRTALEGFLNSLTPSDTLNKETIASIIYNNVVVKNISLLSPSNTVSNIQKNEVIQIGTFNLTYKV